jgi:hypothetical protein
MNVRDRAPDPLELWDMYYESRAFGRPIPEPVLEYFDRVAARLSAQQFFLSAATLRSKDKRARWYADQAGIAQSMKKIAQQARQLGLRPIADPGRAVLHALEMDRRGRGNVFRRRLLTIRTRDIAEEVASLILDGWKKYFAIGDDDTDTGVARRRKISVQKVRRAWKQHPTVLAETRAQIKRFKAMGVRVESPDKA